MCVAFVTSPLPAILKFKRMCVGTFPLVSRFGFEFVRALYKMEVDWGDLFGSPPSGAPASSVGGAQAAPTQGAAKVRAVGASSKDLEYKVDLALKLGVVNSSRLRLAFAACTRSIAIPTVGVFNEAVVKGRAEHLARVKGKRGTGLAAMTPMLSVLAALWRSAIAKTSQQRKSFRPSSKLTCLGQ